MDEPREQRPRKRLETLVSQSSITIETQPVWVPEELYAVNIPFLLHFQGRSLQSALHTKETITPVQALTTLFVCAGASRNDPHFRYLSRKTKKALRALLGAAYEVFWQAFVQDEQEERERLEAVRRAVRAAAPTLEELRFQPGERVRSLGDGGGLREEDWISAVVVQMVWRQGRFLGILIRREKDGPFLTMPPERLFKEHTWKKG